MENQIVDLSTVSREDLEQGVDMLTTQLKIMDAMLQEGQARYVQAVTLLMAAVRGGEWDHDDGALVIPREIIDLNLAETYALDVKPRLRAVMLPGQAEPDVTGVVLTLVEIPKEVEGNA